MTLLKRTQTPRKHLSIKNVSKVRPSLKRVAKRRIKPSSISKLKKDLDTVFSRYIRQKYGNLCYTCGREGIMQCGHFISRTYLSTRWDEDNCRPQCVGCNIYGNGKFLDFEDHLIQDLGIQKVNEIKAKRKELLKPSRKFYTEQISTFSEKLKELG